MRYYKNFEIEAVIITRYLHVLLPKIVEGIFQHYSQYLILDAFKKYQLYN